MTSKQSGEQQLCLGMAMNKFQQLPLGVLLAWMSVHACQHKPVGETCDASLRYLVGLSFLGHGAQVEEVAGTGVLAQLEQLWLLSQAEVVAGVGRLVHLVQWRLPM